MKVFWEVSDKSGAEEEEGVMEGDSGGEPVTDPYCLKCRREYENNSIFIEKSKSWSVTRIGDESEAEEKESRKYFQWVSLNVINNAKAPVVKMLGMMVVLLVVPSSVVSAVDLNPHGGFYQREGGNDFFPSQQQQSFFGGGGAAGGYGGSGDFGDMIMTCSRPVKSSRAAKYLAIKQLDIPCDMGDKKSAWCNLPGDKYPWHAVRRFVFENQGLMRRMYGEVRQLSLLRMEFEDDMDDEIEEERRGPPRAPPIPEDHRRNSILTEVLDESLPRILSETPPEDQLLLRDHSHLLRDSSTPRSLPTTSSFPIMLTSTTTSATTTPVMSSSSEEQVNATEVMMGVTVDTISGGGAGDMNGTTIATTIVTGGDTDTASTPGMTTNMARNGLTEDFITEEATQTTAGMTETDKEDESEATITTTEEIQMNLSEQLVTVGDGAGGEQLEVNGSPPVMDQIQHLNDGLIDPSGSIGSDESPHDFINLDKNHIVYFDDIGKNRRPAGGASEGDYMPPPQEQPSLPSQQQKLKAVNACPVKEEVVAPYWANNTRGEILALLNLYPFEQYIHWERCNHENKQMFCRQGCRCEQQYRLHRLLAFDPTNECRGIFSDWFRFPSCCVCRCYLNEYELMMLNAAGQDPPPGSSAAKSRTSERIRSPRKLLLDQLVDGPDSDVQGVDDMHFFYKQGFYHEHNHGAQPRRKRSDPDENIFN